jgi:hypothetical protein
LYLLPYLPWRLRNRLGNESITLSPVSQRYKVKQGETLSGTMTIVNDGKRDYKFTTYARPYSVSNEAYEPDFSTEAKNADAYQWVQFEQSSYMLKAGDSREVPYTIRVPNDAAPGGHYGVLFAETQPKGDSKGTAVERKKRVGLILYMTVNGTFKIGGDADDISIPFFQDRPPLTASQTVHNTGNSDFLVTTDTKIYDVFGGNKYENTKEVPVLPGTTRNITFEWESSPRFGLYKVDIATKFLDETSSKSQYVLIAPLWAYVLLAIIIGARFVYWLSKQQK